MFPPLEQKNKPGSIIIIYDEDERIAPRVATTFIQREVDNVFMLSGGECSQKMTLRKKENLPTLLDPCNRELE